MAISDSLDNRLLTQKEALEFLQFSRVTLDKYVKEGKIYRYKAGQLNRYDLADLKKFIKRSGAK